MPLLPAWCSCWVSSHLREACETQTQVCTQLETVRKHQNKGGEEAETLCSSSSKEIQVQSIHFLRGGTAESLRQISNQLICQVWNCNTEQIKDLQTESREMDCYRSSVRLRSGKRTRGVTAHTHLTEVHKYSHEWCKYALSLSWWVFKGRWEGMGL